MKSTELELLKIIADMDGTPEGAYNIRANSTLSDRRVTENIDIKTKEDGSGIDIIIKPYTKGEKVHIPVIISETGLSELVYNDFYIGEGAEVEIVAGCGIHNCGDKESRHDGIHSFFVGKNAKVTYTEKHLGIADGKGESNMNPTTVINLDQNSYLEMITTQIGGVDSTKRVTKARLGDNSTLIIRENLMTENSQNAETDFTVDLDGEGSSANVISRSVAKDNSRQLFLSRINGNNICSGHTECDAIIMGNAKVSAVPEITANHLDASLIHEAAIGKIAGEQLIKLMTLGLTEEQAEEQIVNGFLK